MKTEEQIIELIKENYNLAIGERTAEEIMNKSKEYLNEEIKVSGRSCVTGEKKSVFVKKGLLS